MQVGSQQWTAWLHEAVRKAAQHHLMVDIHNEYWDDTKVIYGQIGEYAVIPRRSGESWFIGCMN